MQDKIIAAIAAYLEKETKDISTYNDIVLCFGTKNPGHYTHERFCKEFATESPLQLPRCWSQRITLTLNCSTTWRTNTD